VIELTVNKTRIMSRIPDTTDLNNYIINLMGPILNNPEVVSNTFKTELYEIILKAYIIP